ncbi:uncharacterized protein LOC124656341 [Lolium rigidum]|uniref:uncharacterized protein LOC124656341 n=1 Tax=Lolium rigidum TaxID=89674 RepID=UPI001F5E0C56|nr:uncharacterized protein LOC124656341 [Lolium rigidum]
MRPSVRPRCFANKTSIKTQQQPTPSLVISHPLESPVTPVGSSSIPGRRLPQPPHASGRRPSASSASGSGGRRRGRCLPAVLRVHLPFGAATGQGQPRPVLAAASVPTKTCVDEVHIYSLADNGQKQNNYRPGAGEQRERELRLGRSRQLFATHSSCRPNTCRVLQSQAASSLVGPRTCWITSALLSITAFTHCRCRWFLVGRAKYNHSTRQWFITNKCTMPDWSFRPANTNSYEDVLLYIAPLYLDETYFTSTLNSNGIVWCEPRLL